MDAIAEASESDAGGGGGDTAEDGEQHATGFEEAGLERQVSFQEEAEAGAEAGGVEGAEEAKGNSLDPFREEMPSILSGGMGLARKMSVQSMQGSLAGTDCSAEDMGARPSRLEQRRHERDQRRRSSLGSLLDASLSSSRGTRSNSKRRRSSVSKETAMSAIGGLQEEASTGAGIILDFMAREDMRNRRAASLGRSGQSKGGVSASLRQLQVMDYASYKFASKMIRRDALKETLMDYVTPESKERGMFQKTDGEELRRWVRILKRFSRDVSCLSKDVQIVLLQWSAMRVHERDLPLSVADRMGRGEEFWSTYSDRHRIVSGRIKADGGAGGGGGRPKYGMAWDVQRGPVWRMNTPSPGTLLHKELAKVEQKAGVVNGDRGMGYKTRSSPDLSKAKGASAASLGADLHTCSTVRSLQRDILPPIEHRHKYFNNCDEVPIPLSFVAGHSKSLSAAGRNLVDKELLPLASVFEDMERVEEVDLYDNALLTDRGLSRFLELLKTEEIFASLSRLSIGRCLRAGNSTVMVTTGLVPSCTVLRELCLSQVPIASKLQTSLASAIGNHPTLQVVDLAETGLLPSEGTMKCLTSILSSRTLRSLDLSWNCFDGKTFKLLGELVTYNHKLQTLKVANCSAALDMRPAQDVVPPLSLFLEMLSHDRSLTSLDISMNRCDFRTALILEDSLDNHKKLKELNMSQNPLGVLGVRSILRLLCRDHTGLTSFNMEACYGGKVMNMGAREVAVFSYTNPGGMYRLELWRPYDRALLRMLYKTTQQFQLQKEEAFEKIVYRKKGLPASYVHAEKNSDGVFEIAEEGELELVYTVEKAILKRFLSPGPSAIDELDNAGFLSGYFKEMRFQPGFKKVLSLFAFWSELEANGDEIGQDVYLDALSKDFNLSLPYLKILARASAKMSAETITRLTQAVPGDEATRYLCAQLYPSLETLVLAERQMLNLLEFNMANPTGHYRLNLANSSDYAVGERLLLLDRWEAAVDRKLERQDVSQLGNATHLRNPIYQGRNVHSLYRSVAEWKLPEYGEFQVDYASNQRPPKSAQVLSDKLWESLLMDVYASKCSPEDRIATLRSISHHFYITSLHMRSLIGYFKTAEQRAEIFIAVYLRIVDLHNAKMFRVRFESQEEVKQLQVRLGYASFFPFFQPENARFALDLSQNDQRLCATMFVQLAIKEKFPHNLQNYGYTRADGSEDPLPLGVPKSWAGMNSIPKDGVFRATYNCAPEYRNFNHRKDIGAQYGFLVNNEELKDEDVLWWTGLMEPPEDVIELLEFFISRYDNIEKPFLDIDGVDGNGVIILRELVEGLDELGCTKFDKKKGSSETRTKEQRIDSIFRYLDQGSEGSVSGEEWAVLGQLWSEFDLSIKEFVHFLILSFGEDLLDAWEALDTDESGEMDEEEWLEAVEKIGYFGPARVVFALLDSSDDGNISFDEFEVLEKYKPDKYKEESRPPTAQTPAAAEGGGGAALAEVPPLPPPPPLDVSGS